MIDTQSWQMDKGDGLASICLVKDYVLPFMDNVAL